MALAGAAFNLFACAAFRPAATAPDRLVALSASECRAVLRDDSSTESLRRGLAHSLNYLSRSPLQRSVDVLDRKVSGADLFGVARAAQATLAAGGDVAAAVCDRFRVHRVDRAERTLVTGYYEPELPASRVATQRFKYPLYRVPDDLVEIDLERFCDACPARKLHGRVRDHEFVRYYTRAQIDAGALAGKDHELAWLDDPVEVFFLHIQGSATLRLTDGTEMQVSYAGSNGLPYTSIGRQLVQEGKLPVAAASLQGLKAYLRSHSAEQAAIMAANERYIFFRTVAAGPIGSLGVPLTAGRSIAADRNVYPPGALAFLRIYDRDRSKVAFSRFVLIQDAGIAIQGPGRIDTFWGTGAEGERIAGPMRNDGELYVILPQ
jgi:membrane-bound lytic murein transglycosylase A